MTLDRFSAFISYSSRDREFGEQLQRALERYRVPRPLRGRRTPLGVLSSKLPPVFRDRWDLEATPELASGIAQALAQSGFLIVICSPHAATSRWVNEEIRTFKALGKEDRIIAVLCAGVPAEYDPAICPAGAFPPALLRRVDIDGTVTDDRAPEPLAPDIREPGLVEGGDGSRYTLLKIVAGMTGIPLTEVSQRTEEAERADRRRTLVYRLLAVTAVVLVAFSVVRQWNVLRQDSHYLLTLARREHTQRNSRVAAALALEAVSKGGFDRPSVPEAMQVLSLIYWRHPLHQLKGHRAEVYTAAFDGTGERIVTASVDKTARVWNAKSGALVAVLRGHRSQVQMAEFSPDGARVVTASLDGTARLWDSASGAEIRRLEGHQRGPDADDDSDDWDWGWDTDSDDGNSSSGTEVRQPAGRQRTPDADDAWEARDVYSARFSPDGKLVVTSGRDGTVRLWDAIGGRMMRTMPAPGVKNAVFSPDGRTILAPSDSLRTALLFDVGSGRELARFPSRGDRPVEVAFSSDNERLAVTDWDSTAYVWNTATRALSTVLLGHRGTWGVHAVTFSPNRQLVLTGSSDATARIWDAATGRQLAVLQHGSWVIDVAFSPDGRLALTASHDSTARLWSVPGGRPIATLDLHRKMVRTARFSPDGARIVTASADGDAFVWELPPTDGLVGRLCTLIPRAQRTLAAAERRQLQITPRVRDPCDATFLGLIFGGGYRP